MTTEQFTGTRPPAAVTLEDQLETVLWEADPQRVQEVDKLIAEHIRNSSLPNHDAHTVTPLDRYYSPPRLIDIPSIALNAIKTAVQGFRGKRVWPPKA